MRLALFSVLLYALSGAWGASAATAEAREVARLNNCLPKKVEVFQQTLGTAGNTIYLVECNLPKGKEGNEIKTANALLVQCRGSLCSLLRPVENKNN